MLTVDPDRPDSIIIKTRETIDEAALLAVLQGEIMAALLRQRGLLVLHACCVRNSESVIGFVGGSTWGKSTLAEYFCQSGYFLLSDDILAIDMSGELPVALSSYPEIRLREEAGTWLRSDYESLPRRISSAAQRISNREKSFRTDSAILTNLYILRQKFADVNEIVKLNARNKLSALISHTRSKTLLTQKTHLSEHLRHCSTLISEISIQRLERAKSLELLPELKDLIEKDL